jgi:hypothetical protein
MSNDGVLVEIGMDGLDSFRSSAFGGANDGNGGKADAGALDGEAEVPDGADSLGTGGGAAASVGGTDSEGLKSDGSVSGGSDGSFDLSLGADENAAANGEVLPELVLAPSEGASSDAGLELLLKFGGGEFAKLSKPPPELVPVETKGPVGPVMSGSMSTRFRSSGFKGVSVPFNATYPP